MPLVAITSWMRASIYAEKKNISAQIGGKLPNVNCLHPLIIFKVGFILFISFEKL
jgi:hypothetical protein